MHRTEELAEESTPSETKKENPQYFYVSQGHVQLEEEIVSQSTEGKISNQVHNPRDFRLPKVNNLYHAWIVTILSRECSCQDILNVAGVATYPETNEFGKISHNQ